MKNIIIFGQMGSGKDTVAALLELMGYTRFKLGAPIRELIDRTDLEDKRHGYQKYGQLMRETFGIDIWNTICYSDIASYAMELQMQGEKPTDYPVVIADGRQENEYKYWIAQGFVPVGIVADAEVRNQRLIARDGVDQSHNFTHDTELQAEKVISEIANNLETGFIIENNESVEYLIAQVRALVDELED